MLMTSSSKALFWSIIFFLVGAVSWIFSVKDFYASLPLGIFYAVLVINTYYSIRLFSSLAPKNNVLNNVLDILLGGVYLAMALHLNNPLYFVYLDLLLFIVASAKYSFLLKTIDHISLLKKKILVDLSGVMLCALTLGGMILGYTSVSAWFLATLFVIANILLFFVWPLYKLD